jgi:lysozyme
MTTDVKPLMPTDIVMPPNALNFLMNYEKFKGVAYDAKEGTGILTIGYGHYSLDVKAGQTITRQEAYNLMREDFVRFENVVKTSIIVPLTPDQYGALVMLPYNR